MTSDSKVRRVLARIIATAVAKGFGSGRVRNESYVIFLFARRRHARYVCAETRAKTIG